MWEIKNVAWPDRMDIEDPLSSISFYRFVHEKCGFFHSRWTKSVPSESFLKREFLSHGWAKKRRLPSHVFVYFLRSTDTMWFLFLSMGHTVKGNCNLMGRMYERVGKVMCQEVVKRNQGIFKEHLGPFLLTVIFVFSSKPCTIGPLCYF